MKSTGQISGDDILISGSGKFFVNDRSEGICRIFRAVNDVMVDAKLEVISDVLVC